MKKGILKVKNTKSYVYIPEPNVGGDNKDFCNGNDDEFAQHKYRLIEKTSQIANVVNGREVKNFATMVVKLKDEALAKSHRPTAALFNEKYPVIGGGKIGELYVQVNSKSLPHLAERLSQAKIESDVKIDKNGNIKPKVGILRSEISAIEDIDIFDNKMKSRLSNLELLNILTSGRKELIVELFTPAENGTLSESEIAKLTDSLMVFLNEALDGTLRVGRSNYFSDNVVSLTFSELNLNNKDLLNFIDELKANPVVRSIYPSPSIGFSDSKNIQHELVSAFPQPAAGISYPKVGLIDCGIRSPLLKNWVKDISEALGDEYISDFHADEMASILIGSKYLNSLPCLEDDGCEIYDIWVPSSVDSFDDNFRDFEQFSDWLYLEIQAAKGAGYRVFSMSINFTAHVDECNYGLLASRIDHISDDLGIIFVLSVGNLSSTSYRPEWPKPESEVFKMLARHKSNDRLLQPSECVSAISVGAINHIETASVINGTPTRYTLRGPSTAYGIKPDVTHYGGVADLYSSGLRTLNGRNEILNKSFGTSLAAPHVAKTLACLDRLSHEELSITALKALVVHNSEIPVQMASKELQKEAREFLGHGLPVSASQIIENEEHSFTLVFSESLKRGQIVDFNFSWPKSLLTPSGKCKGLIKMTLVYKPPINREFGSEYVRANVEASLQQEQIKNGEFSFKKAVDSIWKTQLGEDATLEKNLIEHGFKWWPTKVYKRISKAGFGNSSNWRLRITSQVRDGESYPVDGIEFAVVVSIEDNTKNSTNIYQEMFQNLKSIGVEIEDVLVLEEIKI
ncbi:MAG: S8 family serine peptidase [Turicibacter sp.]